MKDAKHIEQHLERLAVPTVSMNAHARVIAQRLTRRAMRIQSIRLLRRSMMALVAVVALVPALRGLYGQLAQGDFVSYVKLAFSDTGAVWSARGDFLYTLAETVPLTSVVVVLGVVLATLVSVRSAARSWGRRTVIS